MRRFAFVIPIIVGLVVGGLVWTNQVRDTTANREPVAIRSDQSDYESLAAMLVDTDLVVIGSVAAVDAGRTYTDAQNPRSGIKSQLATIEVVSTVVGPETKTVIVEQEASLLDDTPVETDGAPPLTTGDTVLVFLIENPDPDQAYFGVLGRQGLYELPATKRNNGSAERAQLGRDVLLSIVGSGDDPAVESLHGLTLQEALRRIALNE